VICVLQVKSNASQNDIKLFVGITGEYPTQVPESEAVSPWESGGAVQDKQTLVVGGAVANQAKDFPTQALKHQQNKPQVS